MNPKQMSSTRRQPVRRGVFRRLYAVTNGRRKQRVAATANGELEGDEAGRKVATGLVVLVAVHVVAIGMYFFHHRYLEGRGGDVQAAAARPGVPVAAATAPAPAAASREMTPEGLPRLTFAEHSYAVGPNDTYKGIATAHGIDEQVLREANGNMPLGPGRELRIPPKSIVAANPPQIAEIRSRLPANDRGNVEAPAVDVTNAPKAKLVKPSVDRTAPARTGSTTTVRNEKTPEKTDKKPEKTAKAETPKPAASGRSHVVQSGDNLWRIANRYKVDQAKLMKANGITDARKLRVGMSLVIPN